MALENRLICLHIDKHEALAKTRDCKDSATGMERQANYRVPLVVVPLHLLGGIHIEALVEKHLSELCPNYKVFVGVD